MLLVWLFQWACTSGPEKVEACTVNVVSEGPGPVRGDESEAPDKAIVRILQAVTAAQQPAEPVALRILLHTHEGEPTEITTDALVEWLEGLTEKVTVTGSGFDADDAGLVGLDAASTQAAPWLCLSAQGAASEACLVFPLGEA